MGDKGVEGARYRAFISYSHVDRTFGRKLHRRLEGYRLPRRLVGRATARGAAPGRVAPVFRDREEFSAAHDLTAEIRAALAASGALIVVCSPNAQASPWVAREIELFRQLHPRRPVLAALVAGEPANAFPPTLTDGAEPLAADFRREGDGSRLALMKLVAGVVGLGLDELVQRDAQRRLRAVTAVTAAAVGVALSMSALAVVTYRAQREAQRQRAEAEALVEFMLTDLRDRLKGVGRLDVLGAVNTRALAFYADQALERMAPESLERRARILHAMGEDDERRGDLAAARSKFREAHRTTASLLGSAPTDQSRILAHAQSQYWLAFVDYRQGRMDSARSGFLTYRDMAQQLVGLDAGNRDYRREVGFAEGNLCSVALSPPVDADAAIRHCQAALAAMKATIPRDRPTREARLDLANRHAWLSDAYRAAADYDLAFAQRQEEERVLGPLLAASPRDMEVNEAWVALQRAYAGIQIRAGRPAGARSHLALARASVAEMVALDPENESWKTLQRKIEKTWNFIESDRKSRR